ncbi:MAG: Zn-ribbon domain-containing OB-fold protein [Thermoplasmata archaeon]
MQIPRFWRQIPNRYNLIGVQCENCKKVYFPPRIVCPDCHRLSIGKMKQYKLSGKGVVHSYTLVYEPADGFENQVPYIMAIIQLDEGPKITAQIVDCNPEEVKIGSKVEMVFRRLGEDGKAGIIYYGYKFALVK